MIFKIRNLSTNIVYKSGRNNSGKITVLHRASGVNREVSLINTYRGFYNLVGLVIGFSFDSIKNRNCPMNIIYIKNLGILVNFLSYNNSKIWDNIKFVNNIENNLLYEGSHYKLKTVPINSKVFNVEIGENLGGQVARSAGTYCRVLKRYKLAFERYVIQLELPSKHITYVSGDCIGTGGVADNLLAKHKQYITAGERRRLGFRPRVRGVAMNPVDHPHGGGEGKTSGGRTAVSAWGRLTKGKKTVKYKFRKLNKITQKLKKINV